ncbi:hypothetical protein QBC47DRAFT_290992 [Echria macrotheca]|uniref:GIY-YIG domain-containing protein n=1 Tax=Echria macrotheca TaxID=438768 RepID=A0AAJ0BKX4_9PEZI|nr:hypothetical protein QBC47DRAFT_290992 [Echria macrotheca]
MAIQPKPIPALYTVYILRSTVRHTTLYIGSTPKPPRRLSQHNGQVKGGAARTSRDSLRPWEMVGLVAGFPSMVAALKFEWALQNPHLSLHIPSDSRITVATQRKKPNGRRPRRPIKTMASIISNLHLLLRVPSFSRWPLRLHFFAPEVHTAWQKWCSTVKAPLRKTLAVFTDFRGPETENNDQPAPRTMSDTERSEMEERETDPSSGNYGIYALPLDYEPIKAYVEKGQEIFDFEREGNCVICHTAIESGEGIHAVCSNDGCEGVGHLSCWGQHFLATSSAEEDSDGILPIQGRCPKCSGQVEWGDMMKELTLRTRGQKEVEKLLKTKRKRVVKPRKKKTAE